MIEFKDFLYVWFGMFNFEDVESFVIKCFGL